jgi:pimeloyl-ACP methyl ester carboxylesterase
MKRRTLMLGFLGASMESVAQAGSATPLVKVDGLTFPVFIRGQEGGRPILLLHGFPQEPSTWDPIAQALVQDRFQVLIPWQRGYLASNRPRDLSGYTFAHFVADVVGIADALGLRQFDVAGFGIGGAQAWMVAALHPMRVRSVASIRFPHPAAFAEATQSDPEQRRKWHEVQEQLGAGNPARGAESLLAHDAAGLRSLLLSAGLPRPFLDRYVARLTEPGALAAALAWEQAVSLEELSRVPPVLVPSLLVWSEGPALARATAEASRKYVRARYMEVAVRGGHFLLESAPQVVLEPLRRHLRSS